jgi:hypothetical protein
MLCQVACFARLSFRTAEPLLDPLASVFVVRWDQDEPLSMTSKSPQHSENKMRFDGTNGRFADTPRLNPGRTRPGKETFRFALRGRATCLQVSEGGNPA